MCSGGNDAAVLPFSLFYFPRSVVRNPAWIARGALQGRKVKASRPQVRTEIRIVIARDANQNAFAGQDRNRALAQIVAKRADLRRRAHNVLELERVGKMILIRLFLMLCGPCALHEPPPRRGRFGLFRATLLVVRLDQMIPALWADAADSSKQSFDGVAVGPKRRKTFPLVEVHSGKHVRHFYLSGRPAPRHHDGEPCRASEPNSQPALWTCGSCGAAGLRRRALPVFVRGKTHVCLVLRRIRLANPGGISAARRQACVQTNTSNGSQHRPDVSNKAWCRDLATVAAGAQARSRLHTPSTFTSSRTEAADLSSAAFSSGVSLISMICSMPRAPSFTGTPTNRPLMPYSPSRYAAQGRIFF